ANNQLIFADRAEVNAAQLLAGSYFELGDDGASIVGNVAADGNGFLRQGATIDGNLFLSGQLLFQGNFELDDPISGSYAFETPLPVAIPPVPTRSVTPGTGDLSVANSSTDSWSPGAYDEGHVGVNSTVTLRAGTYSFRTLFVAPDATMSFDTSAGDIFIEVEEQLQFEDRVSLEREGDGGYVGFYT